MFGSGRLGRWGGEWIRGLGLGFINPVGAWRVLDVCLCLGCGGVDGREWVRGLYQGRERWGGVISMWGVSLDSLCRLQVQVSVYCASRMSAHLRCTLCSIMLPLIDICFQPCIRLWQMSQIQTCLCVVVGPGFVSTPPAFKRSSASHPAVRMAGFPKKTVIRNHMAGVEGFDTICTAFCQNRCDSSTTCRLHRMEPPLVPLARCSAPHIIFCLTAYSKWLQRLLCFVLSCNFFH